MFVEVSEDGTDNWTTLPDANGHTLEHRPVLPGRRGLGVADAAPVLAHYQTAGGGDTCSPTGTTGAWNAATGSSGGWQEWKVDLTAYAGQKVDIAIMYATDWAVQGLGVWLDDRVRSTAARRLVRGRRRRLATGRRSGHGQAGERLASHHAEARGGRRRRHRGQRVLGLRLRGHPGADTRNQFMEGVLEYFGELSAGGAVAGVAVESGKSYCPLS